MDVQHAARPGEARRAKHAGAHAHRARRADLARQQEPWRRTQPMMLTRMRQSLSGPEQRCMRSQTTITGVMLDFGLCSR